ncbi:unnamed protein product [Gadus morhua 'NCC']
MTPCGVLRQMSPFARQLFKATYSVPAGIGMDGGVSDVETLILLSQRSHADWRGKKGLLSFTAMWWKCHGRGGEESSGRSGQPAWVLCCCCCCCCATEGDACLFPRT